MKTKYVISANSLRDFSKMPDLSEYSSIVVLTDDNVRKLWLNKVMEILEIEGSYVITIPANEKAKSLETCSHVWAELIRAGADRHALLVNLGGGLVSDIGGFCASVYKRGIEYINVPTTVLAMIDASIGGKTGINFNNLKNMVGAFYQPTWVVIDTMLLKTLDEKHFKSGLGEMIKYALAWDKEIWTEMKSLSFEKLFHINLLSKCVAAKRKITNLDPTDRRQRKILNFGHTIGHAFESHSLHTSDFPLSHGEAIAHGIIVESIISTRMTGLSSAEFFELSSYILKEYGVYSFNKSDIETIAEYVKHDKKNMSGLYKFTLLESIGKSRTNCNVDRDEVISALTDYCSL